ncbi:MAG: M48 family metalloprotease [Deltaproteobacteria bacterium]|nr:M48 family metalloprotease [Deltaproteobacteria bacterium]MBW2053056.1 M48 family metalloprotease [Deltaproteobacteria bacterium]MBW2141941.1 M48 family metalloprotease [Deltaproteobacteria bacterium]MBW2323603.1 M48 family metalloprotease [Deltaproteobacteria bacterium]
MFNNLVYFILILLVYSAYQPSDEIILPGWPGFALSLALLAAYYILARTSFARFKRQAAVFQRSAGKASVVYHRLQMRLSILAIVFFTAHVYFLGYKDLVTAVPVIGGSVALTGLAGLVLFALYLSLLWFESFDSYAWIYGSRLTRYRFIRNQLQINIPIILPWLLLSAVADLITLMPQIGLKTWLNTGAGQIAFFLVFLGLLSVVFPVLVRYMWGLTPLPPGPHRSIIESFCEKTGFKYSEIMLWPLYEGEALTAGVMGMVRRWRYILITRSLLDILDEDEMGAVLAHELGHVKRHHLIFYLFFFIGYLVLSYSLFDLSFYMLLSTDWTIDLLLADKDSQGTTISLLLSAPFILIMLLYFRFGFGAFMRNFERQADLFSYRVTGTIRGLVNSLEKIAYYSGQSRSLPSWHHFSVAQRVEFLEACEREPSLVQAHEKKVRRMILAYCLGLVLIGLLGYQFHEKGLGEDVNRSVSLKLVKGQIRRYPQNAQLYRLLGDLYGKQSCLEESILAYEQSLALNPNDPITNNNYAWSLATKPDATSSEKAMALWLAKKAASLLAAPFTLDTLAEALYANDQPELAIRVIDQAVTLLKPGESKGYFLKQRAKFQAALEKKSGD